MSGEINVGLKDCGHASHKRYVIDKCRCDACRKANNEYERQRTRNKAYGRPGMVDAEPVRAKLQALYAAGYTVKEIERLSGVGHTVQYQLVHQHWRTGKPVTRCKRENAEVIMAITGRNLTDGQRVDARAATALVRRWMQAGLSGREICRVTGLDYQVVYSLNDGEREQVRWWTLRALIESKDELDARCPRKPSDKPRKSKVKRPNSRRLSQKELSQMREERESGQKVAEIARKHGVTQGTVSIRTRKGWHKRGRGEHQAPRCHERELHDDAGGRMEKGRRADEEGN